MIKSNTGGWVMHSAKIAISLEADLLQKLDGYVKRKLFINRSQAVQMAIKEKIDRLEQNRLAAECAKLNPLFEQSMADEGLEQEDLSEWLEY